MRAGVAAGLLALAALACTPSDDPILRGRQAYLANCTACHHTDPALDGTMGPAVAGASRELLEARLLRGEYPPGYTPRRETSFMQPLPYLRDQIDDLAAYLAD